MRFWSHPEIILRTRLPKTLNGAISAARTLVSLISHLLPLTRHTPFRVHASLHACIQRETIIGTYYITGYSEPCLGQKSSGLFEPSGRPLATSSRRLRASTILIRMALAVSEASRSVLRQSSSILGPFGSCLAASSHRSRASSILIRMALTVLEILRGVLRQSANISEPSGSRLGASSSRLCASSKRFEVVFEHLGAIWGRLAATSSRLCA